MRLAHNTVIQRPNKVSTMKSTTYRCIMTLLEYIKKRFRGSRTNFADAHGVSKARVSQRIKQGCIVEKEKLYMPVTGNCIFRDGVAYREVLDLGLGATVERNASE